MRTIAALVLVLAAAPAFAEVTKVTISSRTVVANGQAFGNVGPYEKLVGRIEFAIDPAHPRNRVIADLDLAPRGPDKRVHFSADLFVLQPLDSARGNGTLLFEISNRGNKGILGMFNRAAGGRGGANNPTAPADFGDGYLMREGYTVVWVGWQFDVAAPLLTLDAPRADLRGTTGLVATTFIRNAAGEDTGGADLPDYIVASPNDPSATLTVRDRFWDPPTPIARDRWTFTAVDPPVVRLQGGFEPGRVYEIGYQSADARVAGVGLAAIRDAASAFRYRDDLPVRGTSAYVFGISQSGRFLRQFLTDGFNVDERDRKAFDAVWPHIAGAGLGSFNERFAQPGYSSFPATKPPFDLNIQAYKPEHQPKVVFTDTPVEYWGQGRAAAMTHTSADGTRDLTLPANVRRYVLAGSQHGEAAMPPGAGQGQHVGNPIPQRNVMRALMRAMHQWVSAGTAPPASRYPTLADKTLAKAADVRFPVLAGTTDPRTIEGPNGLPFLVPQVDADGNDLGGIRVPELAVPLATTTGWNFRAARIGNPGTILALAGSYLPFARTRAERDAAKDPRPSIEERYKGRDDYLQRIRTSALALIKDRYLLQEDLDDVVQRAGQHWDWAVGSQK